jgi:hypothetical protein
MNKFQVPDFSSIFLRVADRLDAMSLELRDITSLISHDSENNIKIINRILAIAEEMSSACELEKMNGDKKKE